MKWNEKNQEYQMIQVNKLKIIIFVLPSFFCTMKKGKPANRLSLSWARTIRNMRCELGDKSPIAIRMYQYYPSNNMDIIPSEITATSRQIYEDLDNLSLDNKHLFPGRACISEKIDVVEYNQ